MIYSVDIVHTLGPNGTNCEKAALEYMSARNINAELRLHSTLEKAVDEMRNDKSKTSLLIACVVYPKLNELVFDNLDFLTMHECFMSYTHDMVYASKTELIKIHSVVSHPAPYLLAPKDCLMFFCDSNSKAAQLCFEGHYDSCVTNIISANRYKLNIINNYGPVSMGFSVHKKINP